MLQNCVALLVIAFAGLVGCSAARSEYKPTPKARVILPAARDANAPHGLPLRLALDVPIRDPNITRGPDGWYYLVGTTAPANPTPDVAKEPVEGQMWISSDGVRMWKSRDLTHWQALGLVWSLKRDATWAKALKKTPWSGDPPTRASLWAPEIHYLKGTWWIPYSMNYSEIGLLKSTSGKPEGPYRDVRGDAPLITGGIDPSLFEDTDGQVYFLYGDYNIAKMKPDMSGLAEAPRAITFAEKPGWGEGIFMVKVKGRYVFINSGNPHGDDKSLLDTYDSYSAVSTVSPYGPFSARYRAIPHDGHNNLFQDGKGGWWSTFFGSGPNNPWTVRPGVLPVEITPAGLVRAKRSEPRPVWRYATSAPGADWSLPGYNDASWASGGGAFGDTVIAGSGFVTDVGTAWKSGDLWLRRAFTVSGAAVKNPQLYLRHSGPVAVSLNGLEVARLDGASDDYIAVPLADPSALRRGKNTLAVHCTGQTERPDYIDLGIIDKPVAAPVVFTSEATGQAWRYTMTAPADGWQRTGFADEGWQTGPALFGNAVPGANTPWTTSDLWLRRTFTLSKALSRPRLRVFHDEDVQVYIDGRLAASVPGYSGAYELVPVSPEASAALTPGRHTLAVHCHQTIGGQGVDVGLMEVE